ncbi:hypothetical protein BUALT_Bualt12G0092600 [Buddleja alternifolia]|uniref:BSD domain-containing protein n=1 Tax=Buddleja alternifolia TaxID=168488 RepID=A0AAV6WQC9_9LAMI|nr:hypothetical protein BUALT_Bualt12G0092600 [Buddleja alternifolia]
MSSWIPSLFNPFSDDEEDDDPMTSSSNQTIPKSPSSGAKEDLSTVFRGFAAFLAPPQQTTETITGMKNDLAEIQGSFRSGLSLISSKLTSNLLQFQTELENGEAEEEEEEDDDDDDDDESAVGIDEEAVDFVSKVSGRPELWTDFPLPLCDDFDLSDYQREHAANIDHLVPEFVTLRLKICSQISEGKFWLIYFILLLPRLNEQDSKLLSTPQARLYLIGWWRGLGVDGVTRLDALEVIEARATLLNKLQNKTGGAKETSENPESSESTSQHEDLSAQTVNATKQRDIVNESESGLHSKEEDVSFSDLEDDDDENGLSDKLRVSNSEKIAQGHDWVELDESFSSEGGKEKVDQSASASKDKESESEESNDWLTVDDTDFDNLAAV